MEFHSVSMVYTETDTALAKHLTEAPRNAIYTSKGIQNNLIDIPFTSEFKVRSQEWTINYANHVVVAAPSPNGRKICTRKCMSVAIALRVCGWVWTTISCQF